MNLVRERINRGLSVAAAAEEIGVARGTLKALEAGQRVSPRTAKKVADFFGVQVTDLMPVEPSERAEHEPTEAAA